MLSNDHGKSIESPFRKVVLSQTVSSRTTPTNGPARTSISVG